MNSENYENLTEILKYYKKLAEKFRRVNKLEKCLNSQKQLIASAY